MADLPFFVELNEQNLTETLQRSVETPLVINFYAPSHKESADFAKVALGRIIFGDAVFMNMA